MLLVSVTLDMCSSGSLTFVFYLRILNTPYDSSGVQGQPNAMREGGHYSREWVVSRKASRLLIVHVLTCTLVFGDLYKQHGVVVVVVDLAFNIFSALLVFKPCLVE
jgi:hypothetical protein